MRKPRVIQFLLYIVLAALALLVALLLLLTPCLHRASRQRQVVARIHKLGGAVLYDFEYNFSADHGRIPGWKPKPSPSPMLRSLLGNDVLGQVVYVQLSSPALTDDALVSLAKDMKTLRSVGHVLIGGGQLSDDAILSLGQIQGIRVLDIQKGTCSNAMIERLQNVFPGVQIRIVDGEFRGIPGIPGNSRREFQGKNPGTQY